MILENILLTASSVEEMALAIDSLVHPPQSMSFLINVKKVDITIISDFAVLWCGNQ